MIQKESKIIVSDNSGAKVAKVIHVVGGTGKRVACLGEKVKIAVKKAIPGGVVKKSSVQTAVIIRTRKERRRADGSYVRFDDNAVVIIDKDGNPVGTRVFGPVARELRSGGYNKILSLAPEVV
ncbi:50S ribosomal protein L14 [bacterium]|jgi:large subunit ribosomal protein L14|nr:50S ribosomal protein L14 [bacterium]